MHFYQFKLIASEKLNNITHTSSFFHIGIYFTLINPGLYQINYATACIANYCYMCRTDKGVHGKRIIIMDNFEGQVTKRMTGLMESQKMIEIMESHDIHTCLIYHSIAMTTSSQLMLQSTNQPNFRIS